MSCIGVVVNPSKSCWNANRTNNQQQLINNFEFKNAIRGETAAETAGGGKREG